MMWPKITLSGFADVDVQGSLTKSLIMTADLKDTVESCRRDSAMSCDTVALEGSVPHVGKPHYLDSIMCRQTVGPRCKLGLKFRVLDSNQELRWRLRTLKGKMTFAIYRQKIVNKNVSGDDLSDTVSCTTSRYHSVSGSVQSLQDLMSDAKGL